MELSEQIKNDISQNPILLYMKGTKEIPMCGFSNQVVQILDHYGVDSVSYTHLTLPTN